MQTSRFLIPISILTLTLSGLPLLADDTAPVKSREEAEALVSTLKYQTGEINLKDGLAKIKIPAQFRYLDGADAQTVLVRLWHNPPGGKSLGMLLPADTSPLSSDCWAVTINYEEEGYIKDTDAEKIDYTSLMKQMQESTRKASQERQKKGYPAVELIGWAAPPHYDAATHKMYWAKEIKFGGESENTLNYNIRILGRRGVLVLNAIATVPQLKEIEKQTPEILAMVDFNQGNRYADFNASTDKVATYGLAALVAGGIATKMGLFKVIWVFILGAKKIIIIACVAVAGWFKKLFKKNEAA